ncbi:hypothetical protein [Bacillus changyiensis]|uniref:hypothetical protein n=1 Tax=Bacillus changyiensis TaxID=3004103 RepID=UPI0022E51675|nr:hypothetical protein [Bacillus changyiensis]MDA1477352.1 hypothetical protein [Bacillus changyiensis]
MKLHDAKYNKPKGIVTITCKTNIQDRTKIEFRLYEKLEEKKFIGEATVKDGKVSLKVRDSDLIKNGKFEIGASIKVNEKDNVTFKKRYGDEQEIENNIEIEGGSVSSVDDGGYVVHFDHLGKTK